MWPSRKCHSADVYLGYKHREAGIIAFEIRSLASRRVVCGGALLHWLHCCSKPPKRERIPLPMSNWPKACTILLDNALQRGKHQEVCPTASQRRWDFAPSAAIKCCVMKTAETTSDTRTKMSIQTLQDVYIDAELLKTLLAKLFGRGNYKVQVRQRLDEWGNLAAVHTADRQSSSIISGRSRPRAFLPM